MNQKKLEAAEKYFLALYPGGFTHPEMVAIGKKHKMEQMVALAKESFAKDCFAHEKNIIDAMIKVVSRSSMVSVFEKPKFKDFAHALSSQDRKHFVTGLYELLHGNEKQGFETVLDQLQKKKMAKWTLLTVVPAYFRSSKDVFIKPSTTKMIIEKLALDVVYKPTPSWDFYKKYRQYIKTMKTHVKTSLSPSNAAFCGFLMMSLPAQKG
ncbi:MAG: hypothetical protein KDK51_09525 [Deltaproteobacteria bacterium]|nr:hypothetical protein [Deltaproteobacteria bacterium]